jgi:riboflavin synthase
MFIGIIESTGHVRMIVPHGTNLTFTIESPLASELKIDQSLAHNGCCLTVESIGEDWYTVTAIEETLKKTNLGHTDAGEYVNLERSLRMDSLIDGHIVQGHVDAIGQCINREDRNGSIVFTFEYPKEFITRLVEKGSVCVNGVSLTAFDCLANRFSVAIIPYTLENTTFKDLETGKIVNLEFDIIGKYILRWMENRG